MGRTRGPAPDGQQRGGTGQKPTSEVAAGEISAAEIFCAQVLQARMNQVVQPPQDTACHPALTPSPRPRTWGPLHNMGRISPGSCSLLLILTGTKIHLSMSDIYNKTPPQVCLMLCPDHLTTTHLCVSAQQTVFHKALQWPFGRRQCHEPYFQSGGQRKQLPQSHSVAGTTLLLILSLHNHHGQAFSLSYKLLSFANHFHAPIK